MTGEKRTNWLVRYNVGYRILAVCLAIMLWYFVEGQTNPLDRQSFTLSIEPRGLATQMVITGALPQVTVTVSSTKMLLQALQDKDIHAYVDLSDQTAGVAFLPVQASVPGNVQVLSVYPQTVRISLDSMVSKKIPVKVTLQGSPMSGFMTLDPGVTPAQVTVSGPGSLLGGLQQVQAVVNAAGVNTNITARVPLQLGKQYEQLSLNPKEVSVVVPVVPSGPVKTVPVTANLTGTPGLAMTVKTIVVEPDLVELAGPPEALAGLATVSTETVDISGAVDRVVKDVGLVLPAGVSLVSQGQVQVTVELTPASVKPAPSQ